MRTVQTAEGLPIYHEVFDGNQAEAPTLLPTLKKVLSRFGHIKRLIVVADRGLLSLDNIDELGKIKLPSGQALEFILAVPGRRYGEFVEVLQAFQAKAITAEQETVEETSWHGRAWWWRITHKGLKSRRCCARSALPPCRFRHRRGPANSTGRTVVKPAAGASSPTVAPRRGCTTRSKRRIWQK